jgi:hypothetical protein
MPVYSVTEMTFHGPQQGPNDAPAREVDFWARFRHESGSPGYKVYGFWDGDGKGGVEGDCFKVRFCPTKPGRWTLVEVYSNVASLSGQRRGESITAAPSNHPGFWLIDPVSPGGRWYMRSDASHPYILGNTYYSFLSGYKQGGVPSDNDIAADIRANAVYFKKLRFSLYGDHYPHPHEKPFFDDSGAPTDWGDYSYRPNPRWFHQRVDLAVQTAYEVDLIADLILAGPDREESRSTLKGDAEPFLKYIAARYGGYPNVWICLCNEFDIKAQTYTEAEIARFGQTIRQYLPYPTPLSVHATPRKAWSAQFDDLPLWNDHQIIQKKLRQLGPSADAIQGASLKPNGTPRNKPTINDELSYQGEGDQHTEGDTIESHLGAFLGGGYATTGWKPGNKTGHYFWGKFDPAEHTAAAHLKRLREMIDGHITFWKMAPDLSIFSNLDPGFRGMAWPGREYVLGTNNSHAGIVANLPDGVWTATQYDVIARKATTLTTQARGRFVFDAPDSRAVLFHFKNLSPAQRRKA